jgi:hypothetical protein
LPERTSLQAADLSRDFWLKQGNILPAKMAMFDGKK